MNTGTKTVAIVLLSVAISAGVTYLMMTNVRVGPAEYDDIPIQGRLGELEKDRDQLFANDEAMRKTLGGAIADISAALQVGGLVYRDNDRTFPTTRWWCWFARCERTEERCKASIAVFAGQLAEKGDVGNVEKASALKCEASRVAFCADDECFATLGVCAKIAGKSGRCRGVE